MDLIDRYVAAVQRHLPRSASEDIVQELNDNLRSEAEEREQQAGHALTEDEQASLLKRHGHPWLMASKYWPQQHLIGPGLYPYYRQALVMVVFWVVLPITLFGGAMAAIYAGHPAAFFSRVIGAAWNGAIYSVGIVTIVFAILEHERVRFTALDNWNPSKLPNPGTQRMIPRSESITSLVFLLTFLVWWTEIVRMPSISDFTDVNMKLVPAPIWGQIYWPIVLMLVAGIALSLIDLVRPWRSLAVSIADITINLFSAVVIGMVIRAHHYVDVLGDPVHADQLTRMARGLNFAISWSFMVLGAVVVFDILYELWHISHKRARPAVRAV